MFLPFAFSVSGRPNTVASSFWYRLDIKKWVTPRTQTPRHVMGSGLRFWHFANNPRRSTVAQRSCYAESFFPISNPHLSLHRGCLSRALKGSHGCPTCYRFLSLCLFPSCHFPSLIKLFFHLPFIFLPICIRPYLFSAFRYFFSAHHSSVFVLFHLSFLFSSFLPILFFSTFLLDSSNLYTFIIYTFT